MLQNNYTVVLKQIELKPRLNYNGYSKDTQVSLELDSNQNRSQIDFQGIVKAPNIELTVKNNDTLQQFCNQAYLDLDYLPKMQKWIDRQKYSCDEGLEDLQLSVGTIFNFSLAKSTKTDAEIVREELSELKREKVLLMRDFKLFQHYFFNFWKEKARDTLLDKDYLLESIIESPQNLYNICEGVSFVDDEEFGTKRCSYIGFKQPVAFLYYAGSQRPEDSFMVKPNGIARQGEDFFEVFISGKGYPHALAHVSSRVTRKVTIDSKKVGMGDENSQKSSNSQQDICTQAILETPHHTEYYLHKVDVPLPDGVKYTVYTPKIFA